jgi:hypothetical protein
MVATLLSLGPANLAQADVAITGTSNEVRIDARNVALDKLLSELRDKFNLSFSSYAPLNEKLLTGTYTGPLTKILPQLLKDYDYALKTADDHIFLVLTNQQKSILKPNSTGLAPLAGSQTSTASTSATSANGINGGTNSITKKVIPPTAALPAAAVPRPAPIMVTNFLGMQTAPFVAHESTAPLAQAVGSGTSRATISETTQRANLTLQALTGSLARLPQ